MAPGREAYCLLRGEITGKMLSARRPTRLSTRIGSVFAVAVASLVLAIGIWGFGLDVARREGAYIRSNIQPIVVATNRMLNALEQMENAEFLYFLEGSTYDETSRRFDREAAVFEQRFADASELIQRPLAESHIQDVSERYREFLVTDGRIRELIGRGEFQAARKLNLTDSMQQAERLREAVRELRSLKLRQLESRMRAAEDALAFAEYMAIAVAILGILGGAFLWRRTWRLLGEPLLAILEGTHQAAEMRFQPIDHPAARRTKELAELEASFNAMQARIDATTEELRQARSELERRVAERTADLQTARDRLAAMVDDLKAVDKLKSDLFAVVSHELLTPINFITGHGSLLEDEVLGPLNERQAAALRSMLGGAERLTRMVRNMLEFTQLDRGLPVRRLEIDFPDVVHSLADAMREKAAAKNQRLTVDVPDQLPLVLADPDRVGQVLGELLINAVEFTPDYGSIRVDVRVTDDEIVTSVSDTGPGVPDWAVTRITEPFFQADLTSTRQHGGLGLGLAIVNHLVGRMGGKLDFDTYPGRGSTFRFTLPRADSARGGLAQRQERRGEATRS